MSLTVNDNSLFVYSPVIGANSSQINGSPSQVAMGTNSSQSNGSLSQVAIGANSSQSNGSLSQVAIGANSSQSNVSLSQGVQAPKAENANNSENNQNNQPKGYKNQPDINVTGEKILSSMPNRKNSEKSVNGLTEGEQSQVDKLKKRDTEVKTHEQAHLAAGGAYAKGGASYSYQTGPDGRQYAIGGEVQIDTSPIKGDPQATIMKAQVIKAAALAPAQPSGQDKAVAAKAQQMIAKAQNELIQKKPENNGSKNEITGNKPKNNGSNEIQNIITSLIDLTA